MYVCAMHMLHGRGLLTIQSALRRAGREQAPSNVSGVSERSEALRAACDHRSVTMIIDQLASEPIPWHPSHCWRTAVARDDCSTIAHEDSLMSDSAFVSVGYDVFCPPWSTESNDEQSEPYQKERSRETLGTAWRQDRWS